MSGSNAFSALELKPELVRNLAEIGYVEMTLVQAETLPRLLAGFELLHEVEYDDFECRLWFFAQRGSLPIRLRARFVALRAPCQTSRF